MVGQDGELKDYIMLETTNIPIGAAVAAVLPRWKYLPPLVDGQPVNAASRIEVNLHAGGTVASLSISEDVQNLFFNRKL